MSLLTAIKKTLPPGLKKPVRKSLKFIRYTYRRAMITIPVLQGQPIRIILGAAETYQDGWYSTNEQWLDITRTDHWRNVFKCKKLLTHMVAEHVFEHLSYEECQRTLKNISDHMEKGGRIRIAVPDGYNPDPEYLRHVGIAGIGDDAADHKQLLNVDILSGLLQEAGFEVSHLEGYTKTGELIKKPYLKEDGFIWRSRVNHAVQDNKKPWSFPDAQTSLIVDGVKL